MTIPTLRCIVISTRGSSIGSFWCWEPFERWMPFQCRGSSYQNDQRLGSIQEWTGEKLSTKTLPDEEWTRTGVSSYPNVERKTKARLPWEWSSLENLERIDTFCLRLTTLLKRGTTLLGNKLDQDEWMQYECDYEFKYAWMYVMLMLIKQTRDIN